MTENLRIWDEYATTRDIPNKILLRTEEEIKLFLNTVLSQASSGLRYALSNALDRKFKGYAPLPWVVTKRLGTPTSDTSTVDDKVVAREYYVKTYKSTDKSNIVTLHYVLKIITEHATSYFNTL